MIQVYNTIDDLWSIYPIFYDLRQGNTYIAQGISHSIPERNAINATLSTMRHVKISYKQIGTHRNLYRTVCYNDV